MEEVSKCMTTYNQAMLLGLGERAVFSLFKVKNDHFSYTRASTTASNRPKDVYLRWQDSAIGHKIKLNFNTM